MKIIATIETDFDKLVEKLKTLFEHHPEATVTVSTSTNPPKETDPQSPTDAT